MADTSVESTKLASMYEGAKVKAEKAIKVQTLVAKIILNEARYKKVEEGTKVPWYIVGAIHYRECSLSFNHHLHNGDPLNARTTHVPKGRPVHGEPPFTWEESAIDALNDRKITEGMGIGEILNQLEAYNGLGYRKREINSPYLWSWTDQYVKGKYVEDGKFDGDYVDEQCGIVPLIKRIRETMNF